MDCVGDNIGMALRIEGSGPPRVCSSMHAVVIAGARHKSAEANLAAVAASIKWAQVW